VKDGGKRSGANLPKPRPKISLGDFLSVEDDDDDKKVSMVYRLKIAIDYE